MNGDIIIVDPPAAKPEAVEAKPDVPFYEASHRGMDTMVVCGRCVRNPFLKVEGWTVTKKVVGHDGWCDSCGPDASA